MNKERLMDLVHRFLEGKTSLEEDRSLMNYYESFQESDQWPDELGPETEIRERIFDKVKLHTLGKDQKQQGSPFKRKNHRIYKYAALFVGLLGLFYLIRSIDGISSNGLEINALGKSKEAITLRLGNGELEIVNENEQRQVLDSKGNAIGTQNGNQIRYAAITNRKELVYNELTVPYGKRFDLVLSDGTAITLNAGSSIKYPIQFLDKGERKVFLKGEAFFDVTKNKEQPFIVNAMEVEVQVLGTQFNLSFYPEDEVINTVLVEGSVRLTGQAKAQDKVHSAILIPGERAQWSKTERDLMVDNVDVSLYTAWTQGRLVFRDTPFKIIRKKLERHYNVVIINNNAALDEKMYNASFDVETIQQVMNSFKENYALEYEMIEEKIVIN